jgi:hypothetical protein
MSIAVFSEIHFRQNLNAKFVYGNVKASHLWLNEDGQTVECTAVFIPERFYRSGFGELNQENLEKYLHENKYYLYPDMEFRGIVVKPC